MEILDSSTNKMITKTTTLLLLANLIWHVHSQDDTSVELLDLKDINIERYNGAMNAGTMELLGNVENLRFRHCNFTPFNENFLSPLKNLRRLIFSYTEFQGNKVGFSDCCNKLRLLAFVVTDATKENLKKIAEIATLETLYFYHTYFPDHALPANALAGSNVKHLEFSCNFLETIEDGALDGMDKLEVLSFYINDLKTFPTATLASLKNLKELNLSGNYLLKVKTEDFPLMPSLEKLTLENDHIEKIDLTGLKEKLPKLKELIGVDVTGAFNVDI